MGSELRTNKAIKPATHSPHLMATWSAAQRRVASVFLIAHLLAVFSGPWHAPPPASLLSEKANALFAPYQAMAFLDHGYRFFAPDPGPSHLVRYEIRRGDGTQLQGQLPDVGTNRPRLLYHRFFMITETIYNIWSRLEIPPPEVKLTDEQRRLLDATNAPTRSLLNQVARGIAQQLMRQTGGTSIRLSLIEHLIPLPDDVAAGRPLNDPELYRVLADLGEFEIGKP